MLNLHIIKYTQSQEKKYPKIFQKQVYVLHTY